MAKAPTLPKPKALQKFAIVALGIATEFKTGIFISYHDIVSPTIALSGLGPEVLSGVEAKTLASLVYNALCWAKQNSVPPCFQRKGADQWSLTQFGLAEANRLMLEVQPPTSVGAPPTEGSLDEEPLTDSPDSGHLLTCDEDNGFTSEMPLEQACRVLSKNITSEFLERRLKATGGINGPLWNLFRMTLKSHLTISDATDRIEDHIQTGLTRLISRDALRERLLTGQIVEDTQLSSYILRSAYNDCRDEGTEPTSREMYGALTEKERALGVKRGPISDPRAVWTKDSDRRDTATISAIRDTEGHATREAIEDTIYFDECWREVEKLFQAKKPQMWRQYVDILKMCAESSKTRVNDIAEAKGVTTYRAAAMLSEARRLVKSSRKINLRKFILS